MFMKNLLLKIIVSAAVVFALAHLLPGVFVDGYWTALIVALVLGILNAIVRPILIILTLPVTVITLGLFLLVINVIIVYMADRLIGGFSVDGFWWALIFSLLLSIFNSIFFSMLKKKKKR